MWNFLCAIVVVTSSCVFLSWLIVKFLSQSQAQDYITAGACMALGLRFAGSANSDAFDCLYEFAKTFMKMMSFAGTAAVGAVSVFLIYFLLAFQIQFMYVKYFSLM